MKKTILIPLCGLLSLLSITHKVYAQWTNGNNVYVTDLTKNVGIGTATPETKLHINGGYLTIVTSLNTKILMKAANATSDNYIVSKDENSNTMWNLVMGDRGSDDMFRITNASGFAFNINKIGNVGIGVYPNSTYKLKVCGKVKVDEIKVTPPGWCDYVFNNDYNLRPLEEVKEFIKVNKHLPDVTPGKIIEEEGLYLGENSNQMIRKIEELTLYMIQMNDKMKEKDKQIEELQKEIELLKSKN